MPMTITEQLLADQQAVQAAQAALDAAADQLARDQAAMAALAPHISLWDEVASKINAHNLEEIFSDVVARARALLGV